MKLLSPYFFYPLTGKIANLLALHTDFKTMECPLNNHKVSRKPFAWYPSPLEVAFLIFTLLFTQISMGGCLPAGGDGGILIPKYVVSYLQPTCS